MFADFAHKLTQMPRSLRLDILLRVRWLAIFGQTLTLLGVYYGLGFDFPITACFFVIFLSVLLNVFSRTLLPVNQRLSIQTAALMLAFDILQLGVLLYLTGGLENPFAILFLGPVLISATTLPPRITFTLGGLVVACAGVLSLEHYPLPWGESQPLDMPLLWVGGFWFAIVLSMGFIGLYAWQVSEEARLLNNALAATELALAREQHISALDGLAAAAAHELGTPLATIATVAKELERDLGSGSPHHEDLVLMREQIIRCREILGRITQLPSSDDAFDRMRLSHLLDEIISPYRPFGMPISLVLPDTALPEPSVVRTPTVVYGLGNIIENAVDFAAKHVRVSLDWSQDQICVTIHDDGKGFPADILKRIGEPYLTTRKGGKGSKQSGGMGLGFFIAKTLLERSGAVLAFRNLAGAEVSVTWPREAIEAPRL